MDEKAWYSFRMKMVLHAPRMVKRKHALLTTTLCGRTNARTVDGMNIAAAAGEAVTCKFCLKKMAAPAAKTEEIR